MSHHFLTRLSPAAMLVAILALVLAGAGVGYTAGKVGTSDLADNAVTSPKVKNGALKAADMVKEQKVKKPNLGNGGQNDCLWTDANSQIPGLARVGYRTDRFGTTHLAGIALVTNGPGGDGACGGEPDGGVEDLTIFTLPKSARPAASLLLAGSPTGENFLYLAGPGGIDIGGSIHIPYGAVVCSYSDGGGCFMEGVSFPTKSAKVAPRSPHGADRQVTPRGRQLLGQLFQR